MHSLHRWRCLSLVVCMWLFIEALTLTIIPPCPDARTRGGGDCCVVRAGKVARVGSWLGRSSQ